MKHLWGSLQGGDQDPSPEIISDDIRVRIAHSIGGIERQRHALAAKLSESMDLPRESDGAKSASAALLVQLLIDGGSDIAAFGGLRDLSSVVRTHRNLGIDGRHYSRFGSALGPALHSIFGVSIQLQTVSAWGDVFWLIVGSMGRLGSDE